MEWFIEMFEIASDRARFFAIILAALLAYGGIWYTQKKTNQRENRVYLQSKYEELVILLSDILMVRGELNLMTPLPEKALQSKHNEYNAKSDELRKLVEKADMLLNIYTPELEIRTTSPHKELSYLVNQGHFALRDLPFIKAGVIDTEKEPERHDAAMEWYDGSNNLKALKQSVIDKAKLLT